MTATAVGLHQNMIMVIHWHRHHNLFKYCFCYQCYFLINHRHRHNYYCIHEHRPCDEKQLQNKNGEKVIKLQQYIIYTKIYN